MAGMIRCLFSAILIGALCATTLLRPGLADVFVTPSLPSIHGSLNDLTKCWSSILSIQGCETEIFKYVLTGKIENVRPTCCKAFMEVDAKYWPKMFPLNPLFPPILKDGCARINAAAPAHMMHQFSVIPNYLVDLSICLSSLINVQGCLSEIYKSVFTGSFGNIGPMCCKTFSAVDAKCWPQMFPLNPLFPHLLKDECSRVNALAPTHK